MKRRNNSMKKRIAAVIACLLTVATLATFVCAFAGCNGASGSSQPYIETKTKNITVGVTNAAPMNYKEKGKWVGFDTELTLTVFNALGYNVMFKEIEWSNKYLELESGTIDCIWNGFTANSSDKINGVSTARSDIVNMSINYMLNEQCVIRNKNVAFTDENSFNKKIIAYEIGSAGDAGVGWLEEDYEDVKFMKKGLKSQADALNEVNSGTADFAVVDKSLADNAAGNGYNNIVIVDNFDYFELEYYAIGFRKDAAGAALRDKVNILLQAFFATGYLESLAEKYNIDYVNRIQSVFVA